MPAILGEIRRATAERFEWMKALLGGRHCYGHSLRRAAIERIVIVDSN